MKKITYLLLLTVWLFTSCNKKEEEKTYLQEDLLGTWEQTDPVPEDENGDCTEEYRVLAQITNEQIKSITICDGMESSITLDYDFDGKSLTYNFFFDVVMTIVELTDTKAVFDESIPALGLTERVVYTKVE